MSRKGRKVSALRKGMALSLTLAMALSGVPAQALAETADQLASGAPEEPALTAAAVESGTWGSCPWEIDGNGVLTVYPGKGNDTGGNCPWSDYRSSITKVVFAAGEYGSKVVLPSDSSGLFARMSGLTSIDLSGADSSNVADMSNMFLECHSLESLNLSGLKTSSVTSMYLMFGDCNSLTSLDLSRLDTSRVANMSNMFLECHSLASLNLSSWNTSSVEDMSYMFAGCSMLRTIGVGKGWSTEGVTSDEYMFIDCSSLVGGNSTAYSSDHSV